MNRRQLLTSLFVPVLFFVLTGSVASGPILDGWNLVEEDSNLHFVSIKKSAIVEVHTFNQLKGTLNGKGELLVTIGLDSVNTNISIRNKRLRKYFFETVDFPTATISGRINVELLKDLGVGEKIIQPAKLVLALHGKEKKIKSTFEVIGLVNGGIQVNSITPIVVSLKDFDLLQGLEKLKSLANLSSIASMVPVTINFEFERAAIDH